MRSVDSCLLISVALMTVGLFSSVVGETDCYRCSTGQPVISANVDYSNHNKFTGGIRRENLTDCPVVKCDRCASVISANGQAHGCEESLSAEGSHRRPATVCQSGDVQPPYGRHPVWMQFRTCEKECLHPTLPCKDNLTAGLVPCWIQSDPHSAQYIPIRSPFCLVAVVTYLLSGETDRLYFADAIDPTNLCSGADICLNEKEEMINVTLRAFNCTSVASDSSGVPANQHDFAVLSFLVVIAVLVVFLVIFSLFNQFKCAGCCPKQNPLVLPDAVEARLLV